MFGADASFTHDTHHASVSAQGGEGERERREGSQRGVVHRAESRVSVALRWAVGGGSDSGSGRERQRGSGRVGSRVKGGRDREGETERETERERERDRERERERDRERERERDREREEDMEICEHAGCFDVWTFG
jgi:hypothetical protein